MLGPGKQSCQKTGFLPWVPVSILQTGEIPLYTFKKIFFRYRIHTGIKHTAQTVSE